uniref:Uncharacterized protein n=1 Tax=Nelumbo nucifera TaxID=4432 RepID=A0A822ZFH2_NELNU|nr:TPA_asm: hypothetical protein HUJ06_000731 [Nelumbo nucifera]
MFSLPPLMDVGEVLNLFGFDHQIITKKITFVTSYNRPNT